MLSSLRLAIPALLLVGAVGCHHHRPHVEQVRGPDGQPWKLAECEHMDRRCYDVAQRSCPNGFYLAKNPVEARSSIEERREANAQTDNAVSVTPKPGGGNVTTLPPQNKWGKDMYSGRRGKLLFRCADGQDPRSSSEG